MRIENETRGTLIAAAASEARSFSQKLFGLMGQHSLPESGGLILYGTNWIHTFWMRFPLDVIYLNREQRVVGVEEALAPNHVGKPFWTAATVVELRAGAIRASLTQPGDQLRFH